MVYFRSNETGEVISIGQLNAEFEQFQHDGQYTDLSFSDYLTGCLARNNGDLTPVSEYVSGLRSRIRSIVTMCHLYGWNESADSEAQSLMDEVESLTPYL